MLIVGTPVCQRLASRVFTSLLYLCETESHTEPRSASSRLAGPSVSTSPGLGLQATPSFNVGTGDWISTSRLYSELFTNHTVSLAPPLKYFDWSFGLALSWSRHAVFTHMLICE